MESLVSWVKTVAEVRATPLRCQDREGPGWEWLTWQVRLAMLPSWGDELQYTVTLVGRSAMHVN